MFRRKEIHPLGFSRRGDFIGEWASSGGGPGALTISGRGQGLGRAPGPPLSHFVLLEASVKIGGSAFVLSNSENISCVTFLKHKNSKK
jgi:hypothetical protein